MQPNMLDTLMHKYFAASQRVLISSKIRGQTGLGAIDAERPSAHLRFGLQQMKTRGWTNEQWGTLLEQDEDGGLKVGTGPVCILESVKAPYDGPAQLKHESTEQHYIRLAMKELGVEPIPIYISDWNDSQATFEAVENVMLKAIELAEADERTGLNRFGGLSASELRDLFGITVEAIQAAQVKQREEAARQEASKVAE